MGQCLSHRLTPYSSDQDRERIRGIVALVLFGLLAAVDRRFIDRADLPIGSRLL